MKINLTQPLKTMAGETIKDGKKELTLKTVCVNALMATFDDEKIDGLEKMKRYNLSTKIFSANELDLKSEEISKVKELIGKAYGTLVVGQAWEMLDK